MTDHPAFAALEQAQANAARQTPERIAQVLSIAEVAKAGVALVRCWRAPLYGEGNAEDAADRLEEAVAEWERLNPGAAGL